MCVTTRLGTLGLSFLLLGAACFSQTAPPAGSATTPTVSTPTVPPLKDINPDLLKLVIDDQWDRGNDMFGKGQVRPQSTLDWKVIGDHDATRHKAVHDLLIAGKLKTVNDFTFASLIFQHSDDPSELMLAHLLSSTAVAMGGSGKWMMAATLDRYLESIKQPQIFGTQFFTTATATGRWNLTTAQPSRMRNVHSGVSCRWLGKLQSWSNIKRGTAETPPAWTVASSVFQQG